MMILKFDSNLVRVEGMQFESANKDLARALQVEMPEGGPSPSYPTAEDHAVDILQKAGYEFEVMYRDPAPPVQEGVLY